MRCAVLLALATSMAAQNSRFNVGSRLVLVPVTVTDDKGRSVNGLEPSDFLLYDNGRRQPAVVDTIDTGVAPIALVIAVQSSGISAAVVEKVRRISSMIQPLVTGERGCASVLSFARQITWLQECTSDPDALKRAFYRIKPVTRPGEDKDARMLDAVHAAAEYLRKGPNARRVLLLISESRDRGSETALETVTAAVQSADIAVYALTYSALKTAFTSKEAVTQPRRAIKPKTPNDNMGTVDGAPPGPFNPKHLPSEQQLDVIGAIGELARAGTVNTAEALSKSTGGAMFPFTRQKALEDAIQKFGHELHNQYVLSFVPRGAEPGYHTIEVRLLRPGTSQVRARPGYWTGEDTPR